MGTMTRAERQRLLHASDFGRQFGWAVEWDGRPVAQLVDPVWDCDSQFWHHYRLVVTTADPVEQAALRDPKFWDTHLAALMFRNLRLNEIAPHAFSATGVFDESGRVRMRGLFLSEV
jgi:hypothetical protein